MKHLSALKKQYRDDLECLTQSYESRRRVLKEALLLYSSTTITSTGAAASSSDAKNALLGQSAKFTPHGASAEPARHHKARHDEK